MIRFKDDPVAWRREYFREYIKKNREKHNAYQREYIRRKKDPGKARRIEEAKAYYRAELPPIDGVVMSDNRTHMELYYERDGHRFVMEHWFDSAEECAICYTAACDLMKEDEEHGTDYGS